MKVVLAVVSGRPPFFDALIPDRGMACLSAVLSAEGIEHHVFDLNRIDSTYGDFLSRLRSIQPDLVGFKFFDSGYVAAELLAKAIRRELPRPKIVAGGPHVTLFQETILEDTNAFDAIVAGDGEQAILDLVHWVQGEKTLDQVSGAIYRDSTGTICKVPQALIRDLDSLPPPRWEVFDLQNYLPIAMVSTYRGCPYTCAFCAHNRVWGYEERDRGYRPVVRARGFASLTAELEQDSRLGLRLVGFTDSTPVPQMYRNLAGAFSACGIAAWTSFAYVGHFSAEDLARFGKSGCAALWYGIESGDESLRRRMGKLFTNQQIIDTFAAAKSAEIVAIPGFIAGFPGDSVASWKQTESLLREINPEVWVVSPFIPDPGSPVALDPEAYGVEFVPDWKRRIVRREGLNEFEIRTHFVDGVDNVSYWESLRAHSRYPGYEIDRNLAESEFAYLLQRGTEIPASKLVSELDVALKTFDRRSLSRTLERVWAAVEAR